MEEKLLLSIAVISSLIGIGVLFYISSAISIDQTVIDRIDEIGSDVSVVGQITGITKTEKTTIIELSQKQDILVLLFGESEIALKKGDLIEVTGEVKEYEGKKEIVASKVRLV